MKRKIIARKPMDRDYDLVICYLENNSITPFVVWHKEVDKENYFWGHYFVRLEGALKHFDSQEAYYLNAEERFTSKESYV